MNERIQELMKKAMEPSGLESLAGPYMELNPEKFAELIIRESAKVADLADENKCESIGGNILTYFGVKE